MSAPTMTHIDDWIDRPCYSDQPEAFAKFMFWYWRYPAWAKYAFDQFMCQHKLFCTYAGQRYRVTGCSRMGDVWLATDFNRKTGYDKRVAVDDCSEWGMNAITAQMTTAPAVRQGTV